MNLRVRRLGNRQNLQLRNIKYNRIAAAAGRVAFGRNRRHCANEWDIVREDESWD